MTYSPVERLRRFTSTLYKGRLNGKSKVVYDEVPNPCYNKYICYISPFLCLRGQKLQQECRSASSAVPPMAQAVVGPVYPSQPVVRQLV